MYTTIELGKILTQPTIGDDINAQSYGVSVEAFYKKCYDVLNKLWLIAKDSNEATITRATCWLRFLELGQLWFSRGSLMWQLGYHCDIYFEFGYQKKVSTKSSMKQSKT